MQYSSKLFVKPNHGLQNSFGEYFNLKYNITLKCFDFSHSIILLKKMETSYRLQLILNSLKSNDKLLQTITFVCHNKNSVHYWNKFKQSNIPSPETEIVAKPLSFIQSSNEFHDHELLNNMYRTQMHRN